MSWAKHRLKYLRRWREAAKAIGEAVKDLGVKARVYVVGGAAEGRLTVLSDVDVLVVVEEDLSPRKLCELRRKILIKAMDEHGLPWDYPVELHIVNKREAGTWLRNAKAVDV